MTTDGDAIPYRLFLGDCIAGMASLSDKSVDEVICDPPYDATTHEGARSLSDGVSEIPIDFAPVGDFLHLNSALRISRRWTIAFCALEQLGAYKEAAGDAWVRSGVWVRTNGTPQISGDRPAQGAEGVFIGHGPGRKRWNGGGSRAAWTGPRETDAEHPTQKPLWLMERLILDFTDHGDLVCDPFMGSGTTGVAALRHGRRFIGFERDPRYFAIAERRISQTREQIGLSFERPAKPKQGSLL